MQKRKTIGLVAHDNRKQDLVEWAEWNWKELIRHKLVCTGTTGRLVEEALYDMVKKHHDKPVKLDITLLKSGPLGGDQQLGALIAEGKVDMLFFLWDPMQPQPHDVDVKALLRITVLYNIPVATNRATADFLISSELMKKEYKPVLKDYSGYIRRKL
jgi:methylglyoxal synthase